MFPACAGMNRRTAGVRRSLQSRVFPACAGMNRRRNRRVDSPVGRASRMRGDEPFLPSAEAPATMCVFPASAGMNRPTARAQSRVPACSPHAAGMNRDRSRHVTISRYRVPRMRGDEPSAPQYVARDGDAIVFPACAGMNRPSARPCCRESGVFPASAGMNRGQPGTVHPPVHVFPASAGYEPERLVRHRIEAASVPRKRGDEPRRSSAVAGVSRTVFPACAGMNRALWRRPIAGAIVFPASAGMNRISMAMQEPASRRVFPAARE